MFGGIRGMAEAAVPGVVFAIAYPLSKQDLGLTVAIALGSALVVLVLGLIQHRPPLMAISGFLGVAVMAAIAVWRHDARLFYWLSLYKNAAYAVLYLVSILVRWPLLGVVLGPLLGEGMRWRKDRRRLRAYTLASWVWFAMFAFRYLVQHAFYERDQVTRLGFANLLLGIPLFVLVCAISWLILRSSHPVRDPEPVEAPTIEAEPAAD
jgi:hypothetical protein